MATAGGWVIASRTPGRDAFHDDWRRQAGPSSPLHVCISPPSVRRSTIISQVLERHVGWMRRQLWRRKGPEYQLKITCAVVRVSNQSGLAERKKCFEMQDTTPCAAALT